MNRQESPSSQVSGSQRRSAPFASVPGRAPAWRTFCVLAAAAGAACTGPARPATDQPIGVRSDALTGGGFSTATLDLQTLTNFCGANQVQDFFKVVNNGSSSIKVSDISVKLWVDDTSASNVVPRISTGGCLTNAGGCFHQVTGVTATPARFSPACGPDANHQANWEITLSSTDPTALAPGVSWANIQTSLGLANFANFTPGTGDWFSPCLPGGSYTSDGRFAVYVKGLLVFTSDVGAPSCRAPHGTQQLSGQLVGPKATAPLVGPVPAATQLQIAIGLPVRNAQALATQSQQVSDPTSPSYRHYLTTAQFTDSYGATAPDYQALITWAQSNGLSVVTTYPSRLLLPVRGTAAAIERALFVNLIYRQRPDGTSFYIADREPSLNLTPSVLYISGLDNYIVPTAADGSGILADTSGDHAFLGNDFRNAYASCSTTTLDGSQQCVGVLAFDGIAAGDVAAYETAAGRTRHVPVNVYPAGNPLPPGTGIQAFEVAMDAEMAVAMAPGLSEVVLFESAGMAFGSASTALADMATRMPRCYQLTSSFGFDPDSNTASALTQLKVQGQTFFQSSGDSGAYTGDPGTSVDEPDVTLIGGTQMTMAGAGLSYLSETTWNLNGQRSGGGVEPLVPVPDYQMGVPTLVAGGRNSPDAAAVAALVQVISTTYAPNGTPAANGIWISGGTSSATPLWAGLMALVNQQALINGTTPPPGFINPALYAIGKTGPRNSCFHDVTTGNNGAFTAGTGYDQTTGWGSPTCGLIYQLASPTPATPVAGLQFSAGDLGPCLVRAGGTVWCWGENLRGQLGIGATVPQIADTPLPVQGLGGVTMVAASGLHACALLSGGTVSCWGANESGQLGDGTTTDRSLPVPVAGLSNVIDIAVALGSSCALLSGGTVSCWGENAVGQLGIGSKKNQSAPTPVLGLSGVTSIHDTEGSCALKSDGSVWCWGDNTYGQLGDGTTTERDQPVQVVGLAGPAISISHGFLDTCALLSGGAVQCWGNNSDGQVGNGSFADQHQPAAVSGLGSGSGVVAISAGFFHTCALFSNGGMSCWGENVDGELGTGTNDGSAIPVPVTGLGGSITSMDAGLDYTCAIRSDGTALCWGNGGSVGDGTGLSTNVPGPVLF